jgi:hypothetical protein
MLTKQRISPGRRPCEMFHNMVIFYGEELIARRISTCYKHKSMKDG